MADMTVANTILAQYGGRIFRMVTGANTFTGTENSLTFRVPNAKNAITHVVTTLMPSDTYKVEFLSISRAIGVEMDRKVISTHEDVYFDALMDVFEQETGLYATLRPRR